MVKSKPLIKNIATTKNGDKKLQEISFRTIGLGDNFDDFWPRYCKANVLDLTRLVEAYL